MISTKNITVTLFDEEKIEKYLDHDWVLNMVLPKNEEKQLARNFICNKWLIDDVSRRTIFSYVYYDLIQKKNKPLKILDIGAGVNLAQKPISNYHHLTVIDILAHDKKEATLRYYKKHNIQIRW